MAYDFTESTLTAAVKDAIVMKLAPIPDLATKLAVRNALLAMLDLIGDELELIDAAA